jgi:hypothetical protein
MLLVEVSMSILALVAAAAVGVELAVVEVQPELPEAAVSSVA